MLRLRDFNEYIIRYTYKVSSRQTLARLRKLTESLSY